MALDQTNLINWSVVEDEIEDCQPCNTVESPNLKPVRNLIDCTIFVPSSSPFKSNDDSIEDDIEVDDAIKVNKSCGDISISKENHEVENDGLKHEDLATSAAPVDSHEEIFAYQAENDRLKEQLEIEKNRVSQLENSLLDLENQKLLMADDDDFPPCNTVQSPNIKPVRNLIDCTIFIPPPSPSNTNEAVDDPTQDNMNDTKSVDSLVIANDGGDSPRSKQDMIIPAAQAEVTMLMSTAPLDFTLYERMFTDHEENDDQKEQLKNGNYECPYSQDSLLGRPVQNSLIVEEDYVNLPSNSINPERKSIDCSKFVPGSSPGRTNDRSNYDENESEDSLVKTKNYCGALTTVDETIDIMKMSSNFTCDFLGGTTSHFGYGEPDSIACTGMSDDESLISRMNNLMLSPATLSSSPSNLTKADVVNVVDENSIVTEVLISEEQLKREEKSRLETSLLEMDEAEKKADCSEKQTEIERSSTNLECSEVLAELVTGVEIIEKQPNIGENYVGEVEKELILEKDNSSPTKETIAKCNNIEKPLKLQENHTEVEKETSLEKDSMETQEPIVKSDIKEQQKIEETNAGVGEKEKKSRESGLANEHSHTGISGEKPIEISLSHIETDGSKQKQNMRTSTGSLDFTLYEKMFTYQEENERLKEQLEAEKSRITELETSLLDLETQKKNKSQKLDFAVRQAKRFEKVVDEMNRENENLQKELQELKAAKDNLEKEAENYNQQLKQAKADMKHERQRAESLLGQWKCYNICKEGEKTKKSILREIDVFSKANKKDEVTTVFLSKIIQLVENEEENEDEDEENIAP